MTTEELHEMLRRNKALSIEDDNRPSGIRSSRTEPYSRMPLERSVSGKASGSESSPGCFVLTFTVYAHRNPRDADNLRTKDVQDALVIAGFFPDDNWKIISEVRLRSRKAFCKKEERTEIEIVRLP